MRAFSLFTQSASVLTSMNSELLRDRVRHSPVSLSERADELIDCIPGIEPMRLADLPGAILDDFFTTLVTEVISCMMKTRGILLPSFDELEPKATEYLKANLPVPIYPLGPCIPFLSSREHLNPQHSDIPLPLPSNDEQNHHYFDWLDSQPPSSVLYVSLGSFRTVSALRMEELVMGLRDSGVRCLRVVRALPSSGFPCRDDGGSLEVQWCDQMKVLCHPSVCGFFTHCGWNSTLEGIYAGVPLLTFPLSADQFMNSKLVADEWRIGVRVRENGEEKEGGSGVVRRGTIYKCVRMVMDLDDHGSLEMRARARNLQETCHGALGKDGSAAAHLGSFIRDLCYFRA